MEDTWFSRDLPVLDATVRLLDEGNFLVRVAEIAEATGLDVRAVDRALDALEGRYVVKYNKLMTGGHPDTWYVTKVTAAARQTVGQWPTAQSVTASLAKAFGNAAESEADPEKKNKLRQVAGFLGSTGRDVATEVVSKVILRSAGMG
jgi:predicted ArsR family transcriptional regulator